MPDKIKNNPFGNTRVDTPFQIHSDLTTVYHDEFTVLKSVIEEIGQDLNYQSRGVLVIGEPGAGKTHLIMRLTKEVLRTNRIFFIRQPNNPEFILYHIYSRMLESLVEHVPGTNYSQIEHLLSKSFSKIIINTIKSKTKRSSKDETILKLLESDHLNIYKKFGGQGTETKRKNWKYIESKTIEWWSNKYGFSSLSIQIVKGLIKFCSYSDPQKRDIVRRWLSAGGVDRASILKVGLEDLSGKINLEEFALEAISVFGRLSIEDEPLIVVFDQLEGMKFNENLLFNFGDAVKEIFTHLPNSMIIFNLFPDRWEEWKVLFDNAVIDRLSQYRLYLNTPDKSVLKALLSFRAKNSGFNIKNIFSKEDLDLITNQPSIRGVLNCASDYFRFKVEGIPLPKRIMSFEDEVRSELNRLKNDIISIKKFLNFSGPTFKEMEINEELSAYIVEQKAKLTKNYSKQKIISDPDDAGKLMQIIEASPNTAIKTERIKTGRRKFPEYVMVSGKNISTVFAFLNFGGNALTSRLKNFNAIASLKPDIQFVLLRDHRSPVIKAKVAKSEVKKIMESNNSTFHEMDRKDRISFELIYSTITDIRNRDLNADIESANKYLSIHLGKYWVTELIKKDV